MMDSHWTRKLSIDHPELYLPFLEEAEDRADDEVQVLVGILRERGVENGARLLDAPCGTGRHSTRLARLGYRVTGLDLSPLYLEIASQKARADELTMEFVNGDFLDAGAALGRVEPFEVVINMFTSHGYFGRSGDIQMFTDFRTLAKKAATLVVQTINRDWVIRNFEPEGLDRAGDVRIVQRRSFDFETSTIANDWDFYEGGSEKIRHRLSLKMDHRVYSLHELREVLQISGWEVVSAKGSAQVDSPRLTEVDFDSRMMWLVATAL
jgi:SAM-dependent methyltransferase